MEQGDPYGMPIQAACQFRVDECDRRGTACSGQDQRVQRRSGAEQVFSKPVHKRLGVRNIMDRRDRPVFDGQVLVDRFHHRSKTISRTTGCSNNAVVVWIIDAFINTIDDVRGITALDWR